MAVPESTEEFWSRECSVTGKQHCKMGGTALVQAHSGLTQNGWSTRLATAKRKWPNLPWKTSVPGRHEGVGDRPDAPTATPEQQFEAATENERLKREIKNLKDLNRVAVRRAALGRDLLDAAESLLPKCAPVAPGILRLGSTDTHESAILGWADWHGGEVVNIDVMEGYNEYNPVIMCRRAQATVDTALELMFSHHVGTTFDDIVVFDMGDGVNGDLLPDNAKTNAVAFFQAIALVAELKALGLLELHVNSGLPVYYVGSPGNHGRHGDKMPWKQPWDTADWLIAEMMRVRLANVPAIQIAEMKSWTTRVEVKGHVHSLNHGTTAAKGGYGGISFYSIMRNDGKLTALESSHDQKVDYRWRGHIHQKATLPMMNGVGDQFQVGSLVGGNEYALGDLASYEEPTQLFVGAHERRGVTWRYPLQVRDADDKPSRYESILDHYAVREFRG